jgi:hypothetical protein
VDSRELAIPLLLQAFSKLGGIRRAMGAWSAHYLNML